MISTAQYAEYADECMEIARLTNDEQLRDQLLRMAQEWLKVAESAGHAGVVIPFPRRH
jgi:hypothetical protein